MADMAIGTLLSFGGYKWRVLDVQEGRALVVTEYIIDQRPYHDAYKDITWADCALRKYLNGEFYAKFSKKEQSQILSVINENHDNPWFKTEGGPDTEDNVFLLSMEDVVCKYFGDSSDKLYNPGMNQRYWFQRKDVNNSKRIAYLKEGGIWWWWIRTPGRKSVKAVYIHGDGNIGIQGNNILIGNLSDGWCTGGVRPAMWLRT